MNPDLLRELEQTDPTVTYSTYLDPISNIRIEIESTPTEGISQYDTIFPGIVISKSIENMADLILKGLEEKVDIMLTIQLNHQKYSLVVNISKHMVTALEAKHIKKDAKGKDDRKHSMTANISNNTVTPIETKPIRKTKKSI